MLIFINKVINLRGSAGGAECRSSSTCRRARGRPPVVFSAAADRWQALPSRPPPPALPPKHDAELVI